MKIYLHLLVLCTFLSLSGKSQQTPVSVPVYERGWPETHQGLLYLPSDYKKTTGKYAVVLFNHGSGVSSLNALAAQALPQLLAGGMQLEMILNPADKKPYSFIVLSLLNADHSSIPSQVRWLNQNYRIDTTRIYLTGLSMGAYTAMMGVTMADSIARWISAAVPMSSPPAFDNMNFALLQTHKIATWHLSGSTDVYTQNGAVKYVARANAAFPKSSFLTLFNGGHCCWHTYYNKAYKDQELGMSIYEWMLQYKKQVPLAPMLYKYVKLTRG